MHRTTSLVAALLALIPIAAEARGQVPDSIVAEGVPAVSRELKAAAPAVSEHAVGQLPGLARRAPRGPDRDAVRRHEPGPPRRLPRRGADAADLLRRPRPRRRARGPASTSLRLQRRRGRGGELPGLRPGRRRRATPTRLTDGTSRNVLAGWSNARHAARPQQQRAQRQGHGPLRHRARPTRSRRAGSRRSPATGRSPTGRPTTAASRRSSTSRSTRATSTSSTSPPGETEAAHAPRRGRGADGRLRRRPLVEGRPGRSTGRPTSTPSSAASSATTWRRGRPLGPDGRRSPGTSRSSTSPTTAGRSSSSPTRTASPSSTSSTPPPASERPRRPCRPGRSPA